MENTLKSLHYAVRFKTLAKYLGTLALMLATLACVPLLVSLWFGEYALSLRYLTVIIVLLIIGLPSLKLPHPDDVQFNESLTITALAFIIAPLIMTYPMMGAGLSFIDAWFEAVSAITTTGLSTIADLEQMPHTFLFARAWMQWYGGLGIVVVSVAILLNHPLALRRLVNPSGETMITTTRLYARRTLVVYSVITLAGLALLMLLLDDAFIALLLTLAAISTGGFAPINNSLGDLPWLTQVAVCALGLAGAIPFIFYYRVWRGSWREVWGDFEVRALLLIIAAVCLLLSLALNADLGWSEAWRHGVVLGLSAQTTTGFSSLNISELSALPLLVLIFAMLIGGSAGSTAGGIKVLRLLILIRLVQLIVRRSALPPHAVSEARLGGRALEGNEVERALVLILLFIAVIAASWLVFIGHGYAPLPALFEVTSAAGTVGLSSGITSAALEPLLKALLCLNMLLGRVEIIALLVVLYPRTWIGKRTE